MESRGQVQVNRFLRLVGELEDAGMKGPYKVSTLRKTYYKLFPKEEGDKKNWGFYSALKRAQYSGLIAIKDLGVYQVGTPSGGRRAEALVHVNKGQAGVEMVDPYYTDRVFRHGPFYRTRAFRGSLYEYNTLTSSPNKGEGGKLPWEHTYGSLKLFGPEKGTIYAIHEGGLPNTRVQYDDPYDKFSSPSRCRVRDDTYINISRAGSSWQRQPRIILSKDSLKSLRSQGVRVSSNPGQAAKLPNLVFYTPEVRVKFRKKGYPVHRLPRLNPGSYTLPAEGSLHKEDYKDDLELKFSLRKEARRQAGSPKVVKLNFKTFEDFLNLEGSNKLEGPYKKLAAAAAKVVGEEVQKLPRIRRELREKISKGRVLKLRNHPLYGGYHHLAAKKVWVSPEVERELKESKGSFKEVL
jgi:hypothetical protein